jgi:Protein of unknown function (DUF2846)
MTSRQTFIRICSLFLFFYSTSVAHGQDHVALSCSDIRNGTFNYFNQRVGEQEIFIRNGAVQKEITPKRRETLYWEVNWLNDCTYTLKYQSGGENRPAAELKILNKHIIVVEILHVTEDYTTFRTAFDKVTNPTILNDTLWIKQRQSAKNIKVTNPRADSIAASKKRIVDSTQASYATLYVYRPGKFLCFAVTYDLVINGEKAFEISNGCRYVLKLLKPGMYNITAKLKGDQTVQLDVKPGGVYYIQCTATWGLKYHKEVQLMDMKEGAAAFNSSEKEN